MEILDDFKQNHPLFISIQDHNICTHIHTFLLLYSIVNQITNDLAYLFIW